MWGGVERVRIQSEKSPPPLQYLAFNFSSCVTLSTGRHRGEGGMSWLADRKRTGCVERREGFFFSFQFRNLEGPRPKQGLPLPDSVGFGAQGTPQKKFLSRDPENKKTVSTTTCCSTILFTPPPHTDTHFAKVRVPTSPGTKVRYCGFKRRKKARRNICPTTKFVGFFSYGPRPERSSSPPPPPPPPESIHRAVRKKTPQIWL